MYSFSEHAMQPHSCHVICAYGWLSDVEWRKLTETTARVVATTAASPRITNRA